MNQGTRDIYWVLIYVFLAWVLGMLTGYQIGKHEADNYYHNHPYYPKLSEVMDPKSEKIISCQFDNKPILWDYVTPSLIIPGQCHDAGNLAGKQYSNGVIGVVIEWEKACCPEGWLGRVRMYDSSN